MFFLRSGLGRPNALLKNVFALRLSVFPNQKAEPCSSFVPDFVTRVTAAPPAMPWSASKLFVATLTVSIASDEVT